MLHDNEITYCSSYLLVPSHGLYYLKIRHSLDAFQYNFFFRIFVVFKLENVNKFNCFR